MPECPNSRSYLQEVRNGLSQVECYRVDGWQPQALLKVMKHGAYSQMTDDPIAPGNYAAFLTGQGGMIQYLSQFAGRADCRDIERTALIGCCHGERPQAVLFLNQDDEASGLSRALSSLR